MCQQLMTSLNAIATDHEQLQAEAKESTAGNQRRLAMEEEEGKKLMAASLKGMVQRRTLGDIASLEGASQREKGGQRKEKASLR